MGKVVIYVCDCCGKDIKPANLFMVKTHPDIPPHPFDSINWCFHYACWNDCTKAANRGASVISE